MRTNSAQAELTNSPSIPMRDKLPVAGELIPAKPFCGVPTFFRAHCWIASRGGRESYSSAGYHLAIHLGSLKSFDYEDPAQFEARLEYLRALLIAADRKAAIRWFVEEYPACMSLVPRRRRQVFLDGVLSALEKEGRS